MRTLDILIRNGADINFINDQRESLILRATITSNYKVISHLGSRGVDLNKPDANGALPVHIATVRNDTKAIELLGKYGADLNPINFVSPLSLAVTQGNIPTIEMLIKCGASLDEKSDEGSLLSITTRSNSIESARVLLNMGVDTLIPTSDGDTALHIAVQGNHIEILELLLKSHVNVNLENLKTGASPLIIAVLKANIPAMMLLLENMANVNRALFDGTSPLHLASQNGDLTVVEILVEAGADINQMDKSGKHPLIVASERNDTSVAQYLLNEGAAYELKDGSGKSALDYAKENNNQGLINILQSVAIESKKKNEKALSDAVRKNDAKVLKKLLLDKDLNGDIKISPNYIINAGRGITPLLLASRLGHVDVVKLLIHHGADVDKANTLGQYPLHVATIYNHPEVVKILLKNKANEARIDNHGNSALDFASDKNYEEIIDLLVSEIEKSKIRMKGVLYAAIKQDSPELVNGAFQRDPKSKSPSHPDEIIFRSGMNSLQFAASCGSVACAKILISFGADLNQVDSNNKSLLIIACEKNKFLFAKYLLEQNVDYRVKDKDGQSALDYAYANNKLDIISLILSAESKENKLLEGELLNAVIDNDGERVSMILSQKSSRGLPRIMPSSALYTDDKMTLLHFASTYGHEEAMKVLIEYGAGVNEMHHSGNYPLHFAVKNNHVGAVDLLLKKGATFNLLNYEGDSPLDLVNNQQMKNLLLTAKQKHLQEVEVKKRQERLRNKRLLFTALDSNDVEVINNLCKKDSKGEQKADLNCVNDNGWTPLLVAIEKGFEDSIKALINNGADVNQDNREGVSPLMMAAKNNLGDIVKLLLTQKAKHDKKDKNGKIAYQYAADNGNHELAFKILSIGKNSNTFFKASGDNSQVSSDDKDSTVPREAPNEYYCPISMEIMEDPVDVCTGHTFDRKNIINWFEDQGKDTNPSTGEKLEDLTLAPNLTLRKLIQDFNESINNSKLNKSA